MHPSLDASTLTRAPSVNQSQQQQMAAILQQLHAIQGLMPWGVPMHGPSYQAALQNPRGQQLETLGQMAQQPSTVQVAVMQQTPPHLTPLLDSSVVRETSCPFPTVSAVGGDGEAVDPPTQGAVQGGHLFRLEYISEVAVKQDINVDIALFVFEFSVTNFILAALTSHLGRAKNSM